MGTGRIAGKWIGRKHLVHNSTEQEYRYDFLPFSDYEKIEIAREKIYWGKVEELFAGYASDDEITKPDEFSELKKRYKGWTGKNIQRNSK